MGQRGPAPTPTEILKSRGSWRGKLNRKEPKPPDGVPACPKWLDKEARAIWRTLVPMLKHMRVLKEPDGPALARYCVMAVRWRQCEEHIAQKGQTWERWAVDSEGKSVLLDVQEYPHVKLAERLADRLLRLEQQFGLTPSARSRITITESEEPTDNKERFFA